MIGAPLHTDRRPPRLRAAGVVAFTALLSGCGGPIEVASYPVAAEQQSACRALLDDAPQQVSGQTRGEVRGSDYAAVWGDGLVLRCGVPQPEVSPTAICSVANKVAWYAAPDAADDQDAPVVLTTVGRTPALELTVPGSLRPPAAAMAELAAPIRAHTSGPGTC